MAYANLELLKSNEEIDADDESKDALLQHFLDSAQTSVNNFCRQTFEAAADTTRYFNPLRDVSGATLRLNGPLAQITSVTNGNGVLVTSGQYITEPGAGPPWKSLALKSNAGIAWTYSDAPENSIAIVGRWAYSVEAPADIAQATLRMASYLYRQRNNSVDLDRAVLAGNATILPADLPRDIKTLLFQGGYRRLVI